MRTMNSGGLIVAFQNGTDSRLETGLRADWDALANDLLAGAKDMPADWVPLWHGIDRVPTNPLSGRRFSGSNLLSLWSATKRHEFQSFYWATAWAWGRKGGAVRDPSTGVNIVVPIINPEKRAPWNRRLGPLGGDPEDPRGWKIEGWKKATVFNGDVIVGAEIPQQGKPSLFEAIQAAEDVVAPYMKGGGPALVHGGTEAAWMPGPDRIVMPPKEAFQAKGPVAGAASYYAVLLHEIVHSTSSAGRLARPIGRQGSRLYLKEELVAEIGAAFLGSAIGLPTELRESHKAYLAGYWSVMKGDIGAFAAAVGDAGQAAEYVLAHRGRAGWN